MFIETSIKREWLAQIVDFYQKHPERGTGGQKFFPVFPWITPRVIDELIDIVEALGAKRFLGKGELLFPQGGRVDKFCIILEGFGARSLVNPSGFEAQGIGIAPPMHIASGNLNFFTDRPCSGCYFALCDTLLVECSTEVLRQRAFEQPELLAYLVEQFEMCVLSDRFVFACRALVETEDRIRAFLCSWAANFGTLDENSHEPLIQTVPLPPVALIGKILAINPHLLENILEQWEEEEVLKRSESFDVLSLKGLEGIYSWIIRKGQEDGAVSYPSTMIELLNRFRRF